MDTLIEVRPGRRIKLTIHKSNVLYPTIFMIHGLGGRGYQWREQIKHLQDRYNLVVPDLLGHGDSEKPRPGKNNPYCFEALSLDMQALFSAYSSEQNYVFGHSYGGSLATLLARDNPTKIQKLVLITPVSCMPFKQSPLAYFLPVAVLECMRGYLDRSFEKLAFFALDDPALLREEKASREQNSMYVIKAMLQGMKTIPRVQVNQLMLPSLIISGRLDKIIPVEVVRAFYTQLPQHQFYVLEEAAHMVHLEKSQAVNRLLDAFLGP